MLNSGERHAIRAVVRWAGHPGTLAAVLVLLFNDHAGKRLWPGVVTGKLSDLAWMLVAPPILALLVTPALRLCGDRPAVVALAGTAVTFTLAKSSAAGGEIASAIWSSSGVPSRIKGDPSDLVALPLLAVGWWLWKRSRHPVPRRAPLAALGVPLAVVAMVATSEIPGPPPAYILWDMGGRTVLETPTEEWITRDGGVTWDRLSAEPTRPPSHTGGPTAAQGQCLRTYSLTCYRLLDAASPVETSDDGGQSWRLAWDPGPDLRSAARQAGGPGPRRRSPSGGAPGTGQGSASGGTSDGTSGRGSCGAPDAGASRGADTSTMGAPSAGGPSVGENGGGPSCPPVAQLVLSETADGYGYTVIVNYPGYGLGIRDVRGTWTRQDYPVYQPPPPPAARRWSPGLPVALIAGFAGAYALGGVRRLRTAAPGTRARLAGGLLIRQALCLVWLPPAAWLCGGRALGVLPGWLPAGMVTLWLLPMLSLLWDRPLWTGRFALVQASFGAAIAMAALVPYVLWGSHRIAAWSSASYLALLCAGAGTLVGGVLALLPTRPAGAATAVRGQPG